MRSSLDQPAPQISVPFRLFDSLAAMSLLSVSDGRGRFEIYPPLRDLLWMLHHFCEVPHYTYPAITTTSHRNPEMHIPSCARDGGTDQFHPWLDVGSSPPDSLRFTQSRDESESQLILKGLLQHFQNTKTKPCKYKGDPSQFWAFRDYFKNRFEEVRYPQQKL